MSPSQNHAVRALWADLTLRRPWEPPLSGAGPSLAMARGIQRQRLEGQLGSPDHPANGAKDGHGGRLARPAALHVAFGLGKLEKVVTVLNWPRGAEVRADRYGGEAPHSSPDLAGANH